MLGNILGVLPCRVVGLVPCVNTHALGSGGCAAVREKEHHITMQITEMHEYLLAMVGSSSGGNLPARTEVAFLEQVAEGRDMRTGAPARDERA